MSIILSIIFTVSAGVSKALADLCSEQAFFGSKLDKKYGFRFDWWHRSYSSWRKWKNGNKSDGEAFFGSSTFLVWTTDGWHLMDALRNVSFVMIGVFAVNPLVALVEIGAALYIFEVLYNYLKR